jgi:hypothetical protein
MTGDIADVNNYDNKKSKPNLNFLSFFYFKPSKLTERETHDEKHDDDKKSDHGDHGEVKA